MHTQRPAMQNMWEQVQTAEPHQVAAHTASIAALIGTMAGWLPVIVAIIPALYYCLLIYESKTVQKWIRRRRLKRAARRRARKR